MTSNVSSLAVPDHCKQAPAAKRRASLTHRASLNAVAALLDYAVKMLVNLLVVPILVSGLGGSLYGVWQILTRLVGYMAAADGRPTDALRLVIANQQGQDDTALKRRCLGSAVCVWLLFVPVLAAAGIALAVLAPAFTNADVELHSLTRLTCILLVVNVLLANLAALPEAVLRGMNLGYKRMGLVAGLNVLGGFLSAGSIYAGFGLIGVAASQIVVSVLTGVLFLLVVKRFVPWFGIAWPRRSDLRSFFGVSIWSWAGCLVAALYWSTDVVLLGALTTTATVTTYVLTGYAAWATISISELVLSAATPGLGGLLGQKEYEKVAAVRVEALTLSWLLVTTMGSTILLWNRSFLFLWVGETFYAGFWPDFLLVLIMVQAVFIYGDTFLLESSLRLRLKVLVGAATALLCILFALALIPVFGLVGLCSALLAGRLLQTIALPLIVRAYLGVSGRGQLARLVRPGLVTGFLFTGCGYLGQLLLARNWLEWAACVLASSGFILWLASVTGLPPALRRSLIERVRFLCFANA